MDATAAFENLIFMSDADSGCSDADSEKAAIKDALSESSDDSDSSNDSNAMEIEDMEKIINADTTKWEEAKFPPSCERLGYTRKAQYMFSPDEKPSEIFKRYFSDEIIKQITRETNKYAECYINSAQGQQYLAEKKRSKVARWKDINEEDIRVYLGINMLIGIVRLPSWREYWDSHSPLLVTNIPKIMNYTKYDLINKFLQVDASATFESALANQNNKIKFFKLIVDNFQKMVIPNENLTIDERVCRFKGRFHSKVYMPLKPDKWGIKLICLCDSNGLVLKLHFAIKGEKHSHVDDIMFDLLQNYSNYNHKLFLDNYFCHPELIEKLVGLNIFVTGTVRMNRRDLPKIIKDAKLKRGETFYYTKGNLSAIKAKENRKPFVLMTSFDSFEKAEGEDKSKCIRNYNKFMKGVDIMNQYCSYYRYLFKLRKWWKVVFYNLIEICCVNSFLVYKKFLGRNCQYKKFKMMIIEDLLGKEILDHLRIKKNEIPNLKLFASKELHYPAYIGKGASGYKRCQVCKSENKKSRSAYKCEQCTKISGEDVALCILPCFKIFHENPSKYFEKKKRAPLKKIKIV